MFATTPNKSEDAPAHPSIIHPPALGLGDQANGVGQIVSAAFTFRSNRSAVPRGTSSTTLAGRRLLAVWVARLDVVVVGVILLPLPLRLALSLMLWCAGYTPDGLSPHTTSCGKVPTTVKRGFPTPTPVAGPFVFSVCGILAVYNCVFLGFDTTSPPKNENNRESVALTRATPNVPARLQR